MKRVRWYQADYGLPLTAVSAALKAYAFRPERDDGFLIQRVRDDHIVASYVEKVVIEEIVTDPFSNQQAFVRTAYRTTVFKLGSVFPELEIVDPPRSVSVFLTRLAQALSFEIAISPLAVDVSRWFHALSKRAPRQTKVKALQVSSLDADRGVLGTLLLKGEGDVPSALSRLVGERPHQVDRLQLQLPTTNGSSTVTIHRTGTASFSTVASEAPIEILRQTIAQAVKRRGRV